jgi:hypothetical protein
LPVDATQASGGRGKAHAERAPGGVAGAKLTRASTGIAGPSPPGHEDFAPGTLQANRGVFSGLVLSVPPADTRGSSRASRSQIPVAAGPSATSSHRLSPARAIPPRREKTLVNWSDVLCCPQANTLREQELQSVEPRRGYIDWGPYRTSWSLIGPREVFPAEQVTTPSRT